MENFGLSAAGDKWNIEGAPHGAQVAAIHGAEASRLADLALHLGDLKFAWETLEALNSVAFLPNGRTIQEAMWRSAIVHFLKCFGNGQRFRLSEGAIYKTAAAGALDSFSYFKALRHKHVVHDENAYAQSLPGVIFTDGKEAGFKIFKVVTLTASAYTMEDDNFNNLRALIFDALAWVRGQYDTMCVRITEEYEAKTFAELSELPLLQYSPPTVEEVQCTRRSVSKVNRPGR